MSLAARLLHILRRAGRAFDPQVIGHWRARLLMRGAIHQDTTETARNRYPDLFARARALLGAETAGRILSFGCSNGAEVLTLRDYFPRASITGAEINRYELGVCRRLAVDPGIAFIHSTRPAVAARGPYDAIFCMAVLQRRPHAVADAGVTDISRHYPFARFDDEVGFLVGQLRPGGLLIVEHSQYRVEDSAAMALLEAVDPAAERPATGLRFDSAGQLLAPPVAIARIFRRRR